MKLQQWLKNRLWKERLTWRAIEDVVYMLDPVFFLEQSASPPRCISRSFLAMGSRPPSCSKTFTEQPAAGGSCTAINNYTPPAMGVNARQHICVLGGFWSHCDAAAELLAPFDLTQDLWGSKPTCWRSAGGRPPER